MKCVNCNSKNTRVMDTRQKERVRYRRHRCLDCGTLYTTVEAYKEDAFFRYNNLLSDEHLIMVANQMMEGAAELTALAKLFGRKMVSNRSSDSLLERTLYDGR